MDPELAALQHAIQILHQLMTVMQDPQAVSVVSTCLRNLAQLQQQMMQQASQGGGQQGGQPQQAPGGPGGGGMNPIAAALAQRLAGAQQPAGAGAGGY